MSTNFVDILKEYEISEDAVYSKNQASWALAGSKIRTLKPIGKNKTSSVKGITVSYSILTDIELCKAIAKDHTAYGKLYHFVVGDGIFQLIPTNEMGRHACDGHQRVPNKRGDSTISGNIDTIGICICKSIYLPENGEPNLTEPERNAIKLIEKLCEEFNLDYRMDVYSVDYFKQSKKGLRIEPSARFLNLIDNYEAVISECSDINESYSEDECDSESYIEDECDSEELYSDSTTACESEDLPTPPTDETPSESNDETENKSIVESKDSENTHEGKTECCDGTKCCGKCKICLYGINDCEEDVCKNCENHMSCEKDNFDDANCPNKKSTFKKLINKLTNKISNFLKRNK